MKTTRLFSLMLLASFLFVGQDAEAQLITWRESVIDSSNTAGQNSLPDAYGTNSSSAPFAFVTATQASKLSVLEAALLVGIGSAETSQFWLVVCKSTDYNVLDDYVDPHNYGSSGLFSKYYIGPPASVQNYGTGQFGFPIAFARFEGLDSLNVEFNAGESGFLALVHDDILDTANRFRMNMSNLGSAGADRSYFTNQNPQWQVPAKPIALNAYGAVPEPSSVIVLALGASAFLRRRRHSTK